MNEQGSEIDREIEKGSPIVRIVVDALEANIAAYVSRTVPLRRKEGLRHQLLDSEAGFNISKKTLMGLRSGIRVNLHYVFRPTRVTPEPLGPDNISLYPSFVATGIEGEGEFIPSSIERLRQDRRDYEAFEASRTPQEFIASSVRKKPEFDHDLEEELADINIRLGELPLKEIIEGMEQVHPQLARKFFIDEIERQIAQYETYCRDYKGYYGAYPPDPNELGTLEKFLELLKQHRDKLVQQAEIER